MANIDEFESLRERLARRIDLTHGPVRFEIEPGALVKFARATGQTAPQFCDRAFGPVAAPTYLSVFCADAIRGLIDLDIGLPMFLHTDDVAELGEPIRGGDTIAATGRLAEVFVKQGKQGPILFQTAEMTLANQRGEHVATVFVTAASF